VRIAAQQLAISEVSTDKGRLKFRLSHQTSLDPMKLMTWVRSQKDGTFAPDGTVTLPLGPGGPEAAIRKAQEVLGAWVSLV
jgi:transcription-repair coupling factor (superfamily II helicase)